MIRNAKKWHSATKSLGNKNKAFVGDNKDSSKTDEPQAMYDQPLPEHSDYSILPSGYLRNFDDRGKGTEPCRF